MTAGLVRAWLQHQKYISYLWRNILVQRPISSFHPLNILNSPGSKQVLWNLDRIILPLKSDIGDFNLDKILSDYDSAWFV